jgi:hypothetical protein
MPPPSDGPSQPAPRTSGALSLIFGSTVLIAAGYAGALLSGDAPSWSSWLVMIGTSTLLLALALLGAGGAGRSLGPLFLPLAVVYVIMLGSFGLALLLPAEESSPSLWLGLPPGAALMLYGIGLAPIAILPFAYARTFDRLTLRPEDLERIAAARAKREPRA